MDNPDLPYIIGISCTGVVGPVKYKQLVQAFGSPQSAWMATSKQIKMLGWGGETAEIFIRERLKMDLDRELKRIEKLGVEVLALGSPKYPGLLKEIPDAPFLLFVRGNVDILNGVNLGVVGSRRMTSYGREIIGAIVPEVVGSGVAIVSGLAFGVDYMSHKVALESGGKAIAVLASGVDKITPQSNEILGRQIIESGRGAIVSEFPLGTSPKNYFFPFRNRIISGLSFGVLVVEAAEKSGTMHTVEASLKQGREVFAVPGSIFSTRSVGTNKLIADGARVVQKAQDILDILNVELQISNGEPALPAGGLRKVAPDSKEEEEIIEILESGEMHIDELVRSLKKPVSEVSSTLINMEVKGLVKEDVGVYRRV